MIVVHHLENSRSQRVLWLLEELELEYEVKRYERDRRTSLAPPELKAVHPLGKSPVITDGEITVAETGAIIEYLCARAGARLVPAEGTPERLRYTYWLHYAEGSAMLTPLLKLIFGKIESSPAPFIVRPIIKGLVNKVNRQFIEPQFSLHYGFINDELGKSEWFAGSEFSAADIQMSFPLEAALARGDAASRFPRIKAFVDRVHARPAYQRALEKGGPYELMTGK
mgnify:CR=1 FL=1